MSANSNGAILQPLNPADYFTLAMDDEIRRENMPGGLCGFVLQLDGQPDIEKLAGRIEEFTEHFPLSSAGLQQHGKRFYWRQRAQSEPVFFQHHCPETEDDAGFQQATINRIINCRQSRDTSAPIEFHLIRGKETCCFLLRWLHPFCDARGVELILNYLCTEDKTQRERFGIPETAALVNVQLNKFNWWQKIRLFLKANCYIRQLDRYQSVQHGRLEQTPARLNVLTHTFTEEHSAIIAKEARKHTGLTGISLYYIGCLMRALQQLEPDQPGDAYCVPYAFNLRKQKALSPVLGNHIGTLFAQAPKPLLEDRKLLFSHLKQQHAQAMRQQLDYAFLPVMWLATWLSLKEYGKELRISYKSGGERSSFWFSDIGQQQFGQHSFFNADITGLSMLSQISSPPGLALLCCHYRRQLTLNYNYIEPLFSETRVARLQQLMVQELLGQSQ